MTRENYTQVENTLSAEVEDFASKRYGSKSALARAMGISPQHLHGYLTGQKVWGTIFITKLVDAGFRSDTDSRFNSGLNLISKNDSIGLGDVNPVFLDISGAMELTRSPSRRLSQLIQVAPGTLEAWESGESVPTVAQLGALFNQVVALGLARCAEHDHRPAVREERKVAAG